jgi:2'-5' RNA ligase
MGQRLFLGVFPPPAVLEKLEDVLHGLPAQEWGIRWTPTDQRHVTLFFLGDTPESRIEGLKQSARAVASGIASFRATLKGLGAFPDLRAPKTVFVPSFSEGEGWEHLADAFRSPLTAGGFELEGAPFRPHLTLARVKDPRGAFLWTPRVQKALGAFEQTWNVEGFCLVESHLEPSGARYEVLEEYRLKKA